MKQQDKVILNLLNSAINEKKAVCSRKINWEKVFEESEEHDITSLVYWSIDKKSLECIDEKLLNKWKKTIFISGIQQSAMINTICEFLRDMNTMKIEIIVLKGMVLRSYYPQADLRTMGDADVLIHKEDYKAVREYLLDHGYIDDERTSIHERFVNNKNEAIEVHWSLINKNYFKYDSKDFEKNLWNNSIEYHINDAECRRLNSETFLMHMLLHMAIHARSSGFGLRQLYDIAVFIKNEYKDIDWNVLRKDIEKLGILEFSTVIFNLINSLFGKKVPEEFAHDVKKNKLAEKIVLKDILLSGVYGKNKECGDFWYIYKYDTSQGKAKTVNKTAFPAADDLVSRYGYAKKHRFLLPAAWIHRAIRGLFVKHNFIESIRIGIQSLKLGNLRNKIVKMFDL